MNPFSNSDIMPESGIIEEPGYRVSHYLVHEIFWTADGDEQAIRDFELLGQFRDKASARACYNKNKTGTRDLRILGIINYPDGSIGHVKINGEGNDDDDERSYLQGA